MTDVDERRAAQERKRQQQEERHRAFQIAFGQRVQQLRKERGWNQDEFAIQALLHRAHPNKIENGRTDLRMSTVQNIADAFNLSIDELLRFSTKS